MIRYLTRALAPGAKPERVTIYCNHEGGTKHFVVARSDGTHACGGCGRPVRVVA